MSFKGCFIFSSGGHFVQRSVTILPILVESPKEHFYEIILKSSETFKVFLLLAQVAILFSGVEPF